MLSALMLACICEPHELIEEPEHAIGDAREQMRRYNKPGGRVQVGVAPNMIWAVHEKGYRVTRTLADEAIRRDGTGWRMVQDAGYHPSKFR